MLPADLYTFEPWPVKRELAVKVGWAFATRVKRDGDHTMLGRFDWRLGVGRKRALTAVKTVLAVALLAGCSSVPDAVNPVEWYKSAADAVSGDDTPEETASQPPQGEYPDVTKTPDTRKGLVEGLPGDKSNSKYAEPVRREVTPTKTLARRTPTPAETQVATAKPVIDQTKLAESTPVQAAPVQATPVQSAAVTAAPAQTAAAQAAVPPKPAITTQELPPPPQVAQADSGSRVSPDRRMATARDEGPSAPPANVDMTPPPPPDVPETVASATPAPRGRVRPLQEQFQRRLAESAQQTVTPGMVDSPRPTYTSALARSAEEAPIHLVPPSSSRQTVKGGGKGLAAPAPAAEPSASFQVASLDFRSSSAELTRTDRLALAEVARLYKQTGSGVIRIVGYSPSVAVRGDAVNQLMGGLDSSMKRANAVAKELTRLGVPARHIMVGGGTSAASGVGAQVYLDVM